jgi:tripartite-type tricarboxylate transporter receptor subunit TctC
MTKFLCGNTMLITTTPCEVLSHLKSGKVRPIGIATPQRDPVLKDVPTLIEQGINMHAWGTVKGFALPAGTPREIVDYYADVSKKITEDADFKKIMDEIGQPIQYLGPEDFTKFIKQAQDDYGKLIKDLGITTN